MTLFLLHGGEHVVAHVWPSVVVEVYNVYNDTRCLTEVGGVFRVIEPFGLEDAVTLSAMMLSVGLWSSVILIAAWIWLSLAM